MRTYITHGDGIAALRLEERPVPRPGPTDVLVQLRAATLNYRDLLVVGGTWRPHAPRVPGSDGVGVVVEVGAAVTRWRPGDRVAGTFLPAWIDGDYTDENAAGSLGGVAADGVLTELRLFDEQALVAVPAHLSDVEGAALPVAALTAWHALVRRGRVRPGDRVLIQGTGGVSLAALQFAHALGAEPIVLSSRDDKLARARALGAAATINYATTPAWEDAVLALTDGRGVDHVVEVVGGGHLDRSLRVVRRSGSIAFIGLLAGTRAPIDTWQLVARNVALHGIETGSRAMFEEMNRFVEARRITPVIDRTFAFAELPEALDHLAGGTHFGKLGIVF